MEHRGLADLRVDADFRLEDSRAVGLPDLFLDGGGEADAGVVLRKEDSVDLDIRIQFLDNHTDIVNHAKAVVGHGVRQHGDKQEIRRNKGVDGDKPQGRRAIKDDVVVLWQGGGEQLLQDGLPLDGSGNLQLYARHLQAGGDDIEVLADLHDGEVPLLFQRMINDSFWEFVDMAARKVRLGVQVHQQHPLTLGGEDGTDGARRCRLSDAALVISE